ncbi:MAG: response regulator [Candidatus Omnitrophica bacterium]|nr:response regulator [Candidatus Omnitrophota bacterium]
MSRNIYTTFDVAKACQVSINTVVNWIKDGSLKAYKTKGGHRRVKENDLIDFIKEHKIPVSQKERILIVDDDATIRIGLKDIFESNGYEVDLAYNCFRARLIFEERQPSLIILDLILPGINGLDFCRNIRCSEILRRTKIVLLTGYPSTENYLQARKAGVNKCIAKPVESEELVKIVEQLLDSSGRFPANYDSIRILE